MKWFKRIFWGFTSLILISIILDYLITICYLKSNEVNGEMQIFDEIIDSEIQYDLDIYGSSRAMVHFNTLILDSILNINSFNYGYNGKRFYLQKLRYNFIKSKNKISKNVIFSIDSFTLEYIKDYDDDQRIDELIPLYIYDLELYSFLKEKYKVNKSDFIIPLKRYFNLETFRFLKKNILYYKKSTQKVRIKGFQGSHREWKDARWDTISQIYTQDREMINKFEQFILDLKKKNINLIFVYSPIYKKGRELEVGRENILHYYKDVSNKFNIPFFDYSYDSISNQKNLFYNSIHLNTKGADIFTKKLAQDIKPYLK